LRGVSLLATIGSQQVVFPHVFPRRGSRSEPKAREETRRRKKWSQQIHDVHNHDESTDIDACTTPEGEFVFDGWGRMGERKYTYVE